MKKHPLTLALLRVRVMPLLVALALPAAATEIDVGKTGKLDSSGLLAAIGAEIGDAACDNTAQCRTLPVGAKACGGPEAYLAWSSKRSNEKTLRAMAEAQQAASRADNKRSGMASNCAIVTDAGASCLPPAAGGTASGTCTLNGPGASAR